MVGVLVLVVAVVVVGVLVLVVVVVEAAGDRTMVFSLRILAGVVVRSPVAVEGGDHINDQSYL